MKVNRRKVFIGAALVVALISGREVLYLKSERSVLDNSDQFILYSLTPRPDPGDKRIKGLFHRNGVLGQTQITDPKVRAELVDALYDAMPGFMEGYGDLDCFNPHHGIRATRGGRTVDAEICFECEAVYFYENGKSWEVPLVSRPRNRPRQVFDQALTDAHVPLAAPFP